MPVQKSTAPRFEVVVENKYVPAESRPDQQYYFFAYHVKIQNKGTERAQLISRHWIITDGFGRTEEVKGPGVIGKQPHIAAGTAFEYDSACPLPTSTGSMRGTYTMKSDSGDEFTIEIPEFYLVSPTGLH